MKIEKAIKNKKETKLVKKETKKKGLKDKKDVKWFKKPLAISGFVMLGLLVSLLIARPAIVTGELNWDYILNKIEQHDKQITDLENKTDTTQIQTNQNTSDITNVQNQANSVQQQTTQNTSDIKDIQQKIAPPPDPNLNSWTNSHGTFVYKDLGTKMPMYTGKSFSSGIKGVGLLYMSADCYMPGDPPFSIPANTKVISTTPHIPGWDAADYLIDATDHVSQMCGKKATYFYITINFSNDPNSVFFPGKFDLWW